MLTTYISVSFTQIVYFKWIFDATVCSNI